MSSGKVKRVLVYRMGSLGDHLVALPSYRLVARAFPEAERRLLTTVPVAKVAASAEAVLRGTGLIDGYMTYVAGERSPWALLKLVLQIRLWRPDVLVYMSGPLKQLRRDQKFFRLCGLKRQIGVPLGEDCQLRVVGFRDGAAWYEQEGERLARSLKELGDAHVEDAANWSPGLSEAERAAGAVLLEPLRGGKFFAFSIGTKVQANEWGAERWRELLGRSAEEYPGYGLVMVGAEAERAASEAVGEAWSAAGGGLVVNLCGACEPRVSAAVLERAEMFFGHDSGPGHMAASVGTPVFGIYGARNRPGEWAPHGDKVRVVMHWVDCGGCLLDTCVEQKKKCILSIGVGEALAAAREHWKSVGQIEERIR